MGRELSPARRPTANVYGLTGDVHIGCNNRALQTVRIVLMGVNDIRIQM